MKPLVLEKLYRSELSSGYVKHNERITGHILTRIYNCTKHGNRPIDNATTAVLHCKFRLTTAQIV